ncbi:pyruvate formate lyase family protein, partial [Streptococcus gordonii]|uniref:pyruvate formate lyase family protein n=1 Tax=Streptococcus gordonii TaxID=1302 RepID=UPI001D08D272
RQLLINKAPKFGNNIEEVDKYAGWLIGFIDYSFQQYHDAHGGPYTTLVATQAYNIELGKLIGATPDGRLAGEAL